MAESRGQAGIARAQAHDRPLDRFNPKTPDLLQDPYPAYQKYRTLDPVHWGLAGLAGYPGAWYLFRHADGTAALKDSRLGKERPRVEYGEVDAEGQDRLARPPVPEAARPFFELARNFIVHRDPPAHTRLRSLVSQAFTPRAVEAMRPRIAALVHRLLDRVEARGEMEFIDEFAFPLPVQVISEMLGLPEDAQDLFARWSKDFQRVDVRTSEAGWERAGTSVREARAYLAELIEERRQRPAEDLITSLIAAEQGGESLTHEELTANILFLFVAGAGFQTTTGLLGNGLLALLRNPDQLAALRADPALVSAAVEEMLRYESPIQMTNRTAKEDLEIGGRRIRAGDSVLVVIAAANRDPEVFEEPDEFRITREEGRHFAFGVGPHFCLGGPLARLEGEVAFEILVERLPRLRLAEVPPRWSDNAAIRVLEALPVAF